jgi:hydroxymethylglutaryl-CoA synthase
MVDRALDELGHPRLSRHLEVPEFKHACLGGMYALKGALRYLAYDGAGRKAIVVCSDVAEYERGSTGEQTRAPARWPCSWKRRPRLFEVDLAHAGSASDYRGPDFRKPFARHSPRATPRAPSASPTFRSSRASTRPSPTSTRPCTRWRRCCAGSRLTGRYYEEVHHLFFHRPYHMMPVQAMSFLYVRGLARGDRRHDELRALCAAARGVVDDVVRGGASAPDLFGSMIVDGDARAIPTPRPARPPACCGSQALGSRDLLVEKMSLGSDLVADFGNLYSARVARMDRRRLRVGRREGPRADRIPRWSRSATAAATPPRRGRSAPSPVGRRLRARINVRAALADARST